MNLYTKTNAGLLMLILFTASIAAQNSYPSQFRGENCSGIASPDAAPPVDLSPEENLVWKAKIASGVSSPCIWDDKLFLTGSNTADSGLITYCLDKKTGIILWERIVYPDTLENVHAVGSQAASTPTANGKQVFVYFGSYGLLSYDTEGNLVWEKRMPIVESMYGSCASPIIVDDKLILFRKEKNGPALFAFDPVTGRLIWEKTLTIPPGIDISFIQTKSTPVIWNDHIIIHQTMGLTAVSVKDGTESWTLGLISTGTGTPVVAKDVLFVNGFINTGESRLYDKFPDYNTMLNQYDLNADNVLQIAEIPEDKALFRRPGLDLPYHYDTLFTWKMTAQNFGYDIDRNQIMDESEWNRMKAFWSKWFIDHGVVAVRLNADKPETIWKENGYVAEVPSLLCTGNRTYMITNGGIITCMDSESGAVIFREKIGAPGAYLASPLLAAGNIYFASYNGRITVVEPNDKLKVISQSDLKEKIAASPVAAGNSLYVRTSGGLYAFEK